jgi:hypothetical protein
LSSWGIHSEKARHSCEGRNPEMSASSRLNARLGGMMKKHNDEIHENSDQIFYMNQGTMKIYTQEDHSPWNPGHQRTRI